LRGLYRKLCEQELPHEAAIRLTLARVLVAPAFLYRAEKPGRATSRGRWNDWELATRLSYFLWSSAPDAELRAVAASRQAPQPRRACRPNAPHAPRPACAPLATEFACAWLHIYGFDETGRKERASLPDLHWFARGDV